MFDPNSPEITPDRPLWSRERPRVQAFVGRHRPFLVLVAALVAQLLLLSFQITRNQNVRLIQVWAVAVFDPFERSLHKLVGTGTVAWRTYGGLWQAQQQNQELHTQLVVARTELQQLSEQAAETQRLRALLDFKGHLPLQSVAAEVIATSPGENSNAIFIDKGADFGLTPDLPVVTPEGIIGKTIAVFPYTSQVVLITDPSSGVGCMLEKSRIQGVLKGAGRNASDLHYVMNEEHVEVGEVVLTSGLDQVYPKGLPVGTVVKTGEGNIYKSIVVKPAAALDRLEGVLVLFKPAPAEQRAANTNPHP
jgi:rod shape-determining protein MreC